MKRILEVSNLVVGSVVGFVIAGAVFVAIASDVSHLALIQAIAAAGVLLSVSLTAMTYALNSRKHAAEVEWDRSKLTMESAITLIERAYEILTLNGTEKVPPNDRHVWLTCARHILAAQELSMDISEPTHAKVYQEHLEYWRTRFYSLLSPLGKEGSPMGPTYFVEKPEDTFGYSGATRPPLAEKSLAVVFRFIEWPKNREDRLHDVPLFKDEEIDHYRLFAHDGLGRHLKAIRDYEKSSKKLEERK